MSDQQPTVDTGSLLVMENRPPRESPLNSANQSRITICSDPPLFHADAYASPESETNTVTPPASSLNGGNDSRNLSSAGASRTRDPTGYTPDASASGEPVTVLSPGPCQPPAPGAAAPQPPSQMEAMVTSPLKTKVPGSDVIEEEVMAVVDDNTKFLEKKDREIEFLELTKEQLSEMVSEEAGLTKDEYFDLNYLAQEAAKVWEERVVTDPESCLTTSRLFPKSSSPLRSTRRVADDGNGGITPATNLAAFEQKHPIMFRRMQRNKARRELFNESMQQHSRITGTDISTSSISMSDIRGKVHAQSPLLPQTTKVGGTGTTRQEASPTTMAQEKAKARKAALMKKKVEEEEATRKAFEAQEEESTTPNEPKKEAIVAATNKEEEAPGERTLASLLKEQQEQLASNEKRDTEVYKPLMASFNKYEENARAKLSALIEKCAAENEAAEEAARLEEERRAREQKALDEGLDLSQ